MTGRRGTVTFEFPDMNPHQRLWQLILYIARASEGDVTFGKVKLAKILYYADAEAFKRFARPITGAKYIKKPYGPVPDDLISLLEEMETSGAIVIRREPYYQYEQIKVFALREPELNALFTAKEIALVDDVIRRFLNVNAKQISLQSHGTAWNVARLEEAIPYEASLLSDEELTPEDITRLQELAEAYGAD